MLFIPGAVNIADFFTKALPVLRHRALAPYSAVDPDDDITNLYCNLKVVSLLYDACSSFTLHLAGVLL